MPVDIRQEVLINPQDPVYGELLARLQGNVLQSHRRDYVRLLLIRFTARQDLLRNWVRDVVVPKLKSAADQLTEPPSPLDRGGFASFLLTASGYRKLGFSKMVFPADFVAGMSAAAQGLGDPDPNEWEEPLRPANPIDAMLLLADDDQVRLETVGSAVETSLAGIGTSHREAGGVLEELPPPLPPDKAQPTEHFGYVDGISQPRFLAHNQQTQGGANVWNPLAPLDLVLVPDPFTGDVPDCYGSFLVFRKLQQNVSGFGAQGLSELAAAQAVGRFKNGTTVTVAQGAPVNGPGRLNNNFDYSGVNHGRCPVSAHVRSANPRTPEDRLHRIVRRGIPYRPPDLNLDPRGILFMCYQASITDQFAFIQKRLATSGDSRFNSFITLKGGEYFFAPSLPFLRGLA